MLRTISQLLLRMITILVLIPILVMLVVMDCYPGSTCTDGDHGCQCIGKNTALLTCTDKPHQLYITVLLVDTDDGHGQP